MSIWPSNLKLWKFCPVRMMRKESGSVALQARFTFFFFSFFVRKISSEVASVPVFPYFVWGTPPQQADKWSRSHLGSKPMNLGHQSWATQPSAWPPHFTLITLCWVPAVEAVAEALRSSLFLEAALIPAAAAWAAGSAGVTPCPCVFTFSPSQ